MPRRLPRSFFRRDSVELARALLGQRLVRIIGGRRLAGLIVEVEAYTGAPDTRAAHTFMAGRHAAQRVDVARRRARLRLFHLWHALLPECRRRPPRRAHCSCCCGGLSPPKGCSAVRIPPASREPRIPTYAPARAKLCQALAIDRRLDGVDLTTSPKLFIERARTGVLPDSQIVISAAWGRRLRHGEWADKPLLLHTRKQPARKPKVKIRGCHIASPKGCDVRRRR